MSYVILLDKSNIIPKGGKLVLVKGQNILGIKIPCGSQNQS